MLLKIACDIDLAVLIASCNLLVHLKMKKRKDNKLLVCEKKQMNISLHLVVGSPIRVADFLFVTLIV